MKKFSQQSNLVHGFSTRKFGDCRQKPEKFLTALGLKKENLVLMEQVHGSKVRKVGSKSKGQILPGIDGMVTESFGIILGVKTADCLPLLFYDPLRRIIGVAHAGWQGIIKKIPQKVVDLMIRMGSLPQEIIVGIGPHIGGCCYLVDPDRVKRFEKEFGKLEGMIQEDKKGLHLDLVPPVILQLVHSGLSRGNIDFSPVCTVCQNQEFFSYRRDSKKTYGGMLGVISFVI